MNHGAGREFHHGPESAIIDGRDAHSVVAMPPGDLMHDASIHQPPHDQNPVIKERFAQLPAGFR
jgi:hypothetical protein